jgi:phosphoribosylformylglycinamidine synthase subunit PurS
MPVPILSESRISDEIFWNARESLRSGTNGYGTVAQSPRWANALRDGSREEKHWLLTYLIDLLSGLSVLASRIHTMTGSPCHMGYGDILADVKKERLFSIEVDSGNPQELAEAFAKELVNENKESYKASFDGVQFEPGYMPVKVVLRIEDGGAISIMYRLRNRLGFENVRGVEKATVWKLYLKGANQEKQEKVAKELLTNPNNDCYEVMARQRIGM